jgi:type II secretory pathway component PulF
MVVLPVIYLLIVVFAGITVIALMMPLLNLVSCLSGGGGGGGPGTDGEFIIPLLAGTLFFLLGVLAFMVARRIAGPAPGDRKSALAGPVRVFAWIMTIVGIVVGSVLVLPGLAFVTLIVIIAMAYSKHVATQQYALLGLVGAAAERSMPLETVFAAFGHERRGWMRQRTAEIVHMLQRGASLPAALEAVPGALPPEAVPLVCVGHENGSLGPAVRQAIIARNLYEPVWQSIVPKIGYICFLPAVGMGVVAFIVLSIMPQLEKIFKDFGTRLPWVTVALVHVCRWPFLGLVCGMVCLLLAGLLIYGVLRYAGAIRWDLPGMDWLFRRRHTATVLDALALAAARQQPLGATLSTLASTYPQRSIALCLWAACDDLQAGGDDLECLHRHGLLGKTDLALLEAARRNGNLAWAAQEMADSNRRRFIYRTYAVLQVIFPLVIIGYGLLMAAVATSVFLPLADLIRSLVPS